MPMTPEEKRRVMKMLDELKRSKLEKVLASVQAFGYWLYDQAYSIYCKVKDALRSFWQSLRDFFRKL